MKPYDEDVNVFDMPGFEKHDRVVFYPSIASQAADGTRWRASVCGRVYEPCEKSFRQRMGLFLLRKALGLRADEARTELFLRRAQPFLVKRRKGVEVSIEANSERVALHPTSGDGYFRDTIEIDAQPLQDSFELRCVERPVAGHEVRVLPPTGLSVISDVDDTIKVTNVGRTRELLANTFLREYEAIDGCAEVFRDWARQGAAFHYVSNSPWQLFDELRDFLLRSGFPDGDLNLRKFLVKDRMFLDFFRSPEEHKRRTISELFLAFPRRRFVLIGDSGEQDPEIYGRLALDFPRNVDRILIRSIEGSPFSRERAGACFGSLRSGVWRSFREPFELGDEMAAI